MENPLWQKWLPAILAALMICVIVYIMATA